MEKIATDTYSFERIRQGGFVYVDKTAILKTLADGRIGTQFFVARPRRFGGRVAAAQPASVAEPQARTASEESLGRVRARQKMFFVQCFQGSGEDPGWTIPEDPG